MEVDSVHSTKEHRLHKRQIYWPPDHVEVISCAREKPCPFDVKHLDFIFFKDLSKINYDSSIRPGKGPGDPQVVDIRALLYVPEGVIMYKLNHSDGWAPLPHRASQCSQAAICQLYHEPRPVKKSKWLHLQELKPSHAKRIPCVLQQLALYG